MLNKKRLKEILIEKLKINFAKVLTALPIVLIASSFRKLDIYSIAIGLIIGVAIEQAEDFIKVHFKHKNKIKEK